MSEFGIVALLKWMPDGAAHLDILYRELGAVGGEADVTAAYVMGVDKLGDEHVIGIEEAMPLDDARGDSYLLARCVAVSAREGAKPRFGRALDAALVLIPAVEAYHVRVSEVVDRLVPMRAEYRVKIAGRGKDGLHSEREDDVGVEAFAREEYAAIVPSLRADEPSVFVFPISAHHLEVAFPILIGRTLKKHGAFVKPYELAEKM